MLHFRKEGDPVHFGLNVFRNDLASHGFILKLGRFSLRVRRRTDRIMAGFKDSGKTGPRWIIRITDEKPRQIMP